jgi:hypothetical protein
MALSGALHGTGLTLVRRPLGPSVPPPVCGVTALINTTTIKQMLHIICNDKTVDVAQGVALSNVTLKERYKRMV